MSEYRGRKKQTFGSRVTYTVTTHTHTEAIESNPRRVDVLISLNRIFWFWFTHTNTPTHTYIHIQAWKQAYKLLFQFQLFPPSEWFHFYWENYISCVVRRKKNVNKQWKQASKQRTEGRYRFVFVRKRRKK